MSDGKNFKDYYGTHMAFDQFPKFGVLSDVKVVMTGVNIAGPYAATMMAEMGAQVIQVESPNLPSSQRGTYGQAQDARNCFSVPLNVKSPRGKKAFEKIIRWADIWIESGRPGNYKNMGLSDAHMWELNPKLAIVHISGYGQYGPDKDRAAYDVSGQAMGGYMYMNGVSPTSPPLKVNPFLSDYATAFQACICALSILTHARATGQGDSADVSQYETMFRLLSQYPFDWFNRGFPAEGEPVKWRTGNKSDKAAAFSFYDCKDGTIFIGMNGPNVVKRGYPLIGLPTPGDGTDPDFFEGMSGSLIQLPVGQRIERALEKFCAERTVDEVEKIMNENGIPNQRPFGPADILKSKHYKAREDIITWTDSVYGEVTGIGIMNKFKRNPSKVVASAPLLGEHTREVLGSLGMTEEEIDALYKHGDTTTMDARETAKFWHLKEWQFFWNKEQAEKLDL